MKLPNKIVLLFLSCLFIMTSCYDKNNSCSYTDKGRPSTALKYSEIVAMLQQYDNTRKSVLSKSLGKEDTRVNFYTIEQLKTYIAYVEKLSKDKNIKLTGINFISATYPNNYSETKKRNYQTLILMPTTEIDGNDDVSFDPIHSSDGVPKTFKDMLMKHNYSNWYYDSLQPKKVIKKQSLESRSFMFNDELSAGGNKSRPCPPY